MIDLIKTFLSLYKNRTQRRSPVEIPFFYIDLVDRCNSKCQTCHIWKNNSLEKELNLIDYKRLIPDLKKLNVRTISIGGGEPTLKENLPDITSLFNMHNFKVHINSNGITTKETLRNLVKSGVSLFYFSCDGHDQESYKKIRGIDGFKKLEENINFLKSLKKDIFIGINCVISTLNMNDIQKFYDLAYNWKVSLLQFIPIHSHLQQKEMNFQDLKSLIPSTSEVLIIQEQLRVISKKLKKEGILTNPKSLINFYPIAYRDERAFPCFAGHAFVSLNAYGEISACHQYSTGLNIKEISLGEILKSNEYTKVLNKVRSCKLPCLDPGSAGISLRMQPFYILFNIKNIYKETQIFT